MFYYLYEIRNNLNDKIYVGVHKTKKMDDGYMGSGKVIKRALEKYGIDNFTKTVLEEFSTAKEMFAREAEIVNDEFLLREDVYNLRRGGHGGFEYINKISSKEQKSKAGKSSQNSPNIIHIHEQLNFAEVLLKAAKARKLSGTGYAMFKGKLHTKDTKIAIGEKTSVDQSGSGNSQFGTMWITNDIDSVKIKKTDSIPEGWRKGRRIKINIGV